MTAEEREAAVEEIIQRTVIDRGLPEKIDDPGALAKLAVLIRRRAGPTSPPS